MQKFFRCKQAGAEQGQAQLKLELELGLTKVKTCCIKRTNKNTIGYFQQPLTATEHNLLTYILAFLFSCLHRRNQVTFDCPKDLLALTRNKVNLSLAKLCWTSQLELSFFTSVKNSDSKNMCGPKSSLFKKILGQTIFGTEKWTGNFWSKKFGVQKNIKSKIYVCPSLVKIG